MKTIWKNFPSNKFQKKKNWNSKKKKKQKRNLQSNFQNSEIGNPKSFRAVASACAKNPYVPDIPCHRIVRKDGGLGGYSAEGGIKKKKYMLEKESQEWYARTNNEYPVVEGVKISEILSGWGEIKVDELSLNKLGDLNPDAVKLMDRVGWQ